MSLFFKKPRLGVNIDHVRTLERQRLVGYPDLERAAIISLENGADQITIHLREDQRHIQKEDPEKIKKICERFNKPLNFEMGTAPEIIEMASDLEPEWVCLVPEKREERTTEGGLNLKDKDIFERTMSAMRTIREKSPNTKFSLFVEHDLGTLKLSRDLGAEAVEIHTGDYANEFLKSPGDAVSKYIGFFQEAKSFLVQSKIGCHAGHGLTDQSVAPLLEAQLFEEYNIGHWIIAQAIYNGLGNVVSGLKKQMENS